MAEHDHDESEPLSDEELERQEGESLPDREVMTILPIEPTAGYHVLPDPQDFESQ